jgi:hypothetical protein
MPKGLAERGLRLREAVTVSGVRSAGWGTVPATAPSLSSTS